MSTAQATTEADNRLFVENFALDLGITPQPAAWALLKLVPAVLVRVDSIQIVKIINPTRDNA